MAGSNQSHKENNIPLVLDQDVDDFTARDYQVELLQAALDNDIIVYLPTGSGKTFIAALLIKEKSSEVTQSLAMKGRRTVFLVPTVVLAIQQANYLRRHTHLKVKEYYGSMGVDLWSKNQWEIEFESNNVLVMTAQIFVDILNHAYLFVHQVNLLIFDECHAAVKDAPMKQVLAKLDKCDKGHRPKILGLTAALFRKRCKPSQVRNVITQLSESMKCIVKTPSDIQTVYRSSTKPCEMILQYRDDDTAIQIADSRKLSDVIMESIIELHKVLATRYHRGSSSPESSSRAKAEKTDMLFDPLNEILFLLKTFGPYGAYHCALVYIEILPGFKGRAKFSQLATDLDRVTVLCKRIRDQCTEIFNKYSLKDRLLNFVQPRILRLLDLLRKFNPSCNTDGRQLLDSKKSAKLCGIVFVDRRCMANVLYHYLKDISRHDETLHFIKPLFTMGQASGRSSLLKESRILNMKQNEIMKQFREGLCNLLIATSVLEEGIDIPVCNVIIRFDKIRTYCDYVQTKGRARASKAFFCILVNEGDTESCLQDLMEFHSIEQQLINTTDFEEELEIDNLCNQIIHPYAPYGEDGPRVTLQSSISLVNRYCGQLTIQECLILAPKWMINTVKASQVEPSWMRQLLSVITQLPDSRTATSVGELYQCSILLPLNSPLREEIFGQVMPTKKLAKRAAALKMCIKLHELKELDDLHLLPIRQNKLEDVDTSIEEEDEAATIGPQTASNRGGFYDRCLPKCLTSNRPSAGQPVFIYALEFKLTKQSDSPSNEYFPFAVETKLAILSSCNIPAICSFPLVTKAGEFQVDLVGVDCVILEKHQLEQLEKFHRFIFQDVIFLFKKNLEFDPESSKLKYLIAPLGKLSEEYHIDFHFIDRMVNHKPIDWDQPPHAANSCFQFDPAVYADAVIIPSYRPFGTLNTYYVDIVTDLIPSNPFPEIQYKDFTTYFRKKYKLTVTDPNQRLLSVSREISGKNFLVPRVLSAKEDKSIFMVPEFCFVHPLPCSVWKQVVWLPSILHRLNGLLLAEELRVLINKETKIGVEFLPCGVNVSTVWRPLTIRWKKLCPSKNDASTADPRLLLPTFKPQMLLDLDSEMLSDLDMIWNVDYSTDRDSNFQKSLVLNGSARLSSASGQLDDSIDLITFVNDNPVNPSSSWNERTENISFDIVSQNSLSKFGPSPSLVLEALTLTKSNDGFDMERLETIGDSLLKLVIGIYVYGQTGSKHLDEGRLSHMRMQQINNKHLFKLGQQKNLGQLISGQSFDLILNFLPPGFQAPVTENAGETNLHLQQYVSTKNIADSMEALMGVYLLSTGIKGAMMVMNWMGLKTIPDTAKQFNQDNGFPVILPSPLPTVSSGDDQNNIEMLERLYAGLDSFEKSLGYVFKNKLLLIEALTHASYFPNRLTDCYQRLEFLGDAVLDYLVTRFHYDNPLEYSPAELTDLRSAMVNNETFAAIAVRNSFHLYLKHQSLSLSVMVDGFVRAQQDNGHLLMNDYFVLEADELDDKMASNIDVPKVLGDIFESVAGAIFVDSEMSLDAVWRSYLPFLSSDMEKLNQRIPRSPVRELHERFTSSVKFKKAVELPDGRLCVSIEFGGDQIFKGVGKNSKAAKTAAAKYALSRLNQKV